MKVYRLLQTVTHNARPYGPGQPIALTDAQAALLIRKGQIEPAPISEDPLYVQELDFTSRHKAAGSGCCLK